MSLWTWDFASKKTPKSRMLSVIAVVCLEVVICESGGSVGGCLGKLLFYLCYRLIEQNISHLQFAASIINFIFSRA